MEKKNLYFKLAQAQMLANPVAKCGFNSFSKYKYAREADIVAEATRCLEQAGLVSFVSTELVSVDNSTEQKSATITQTLTVADPETGETLSINMPGHAFDKNGDKAIYKASTGANKYAYMRLLCLSTGDDPENDTRSKPIDEREKVMIEVIELGQSFLSIGGNIDMLQSVFAKSPREKMTVDELKEAKQKIAALISGWKK